jgi:hypothetical protein
MQIFGANSSFASILSTGAPMPAMRIPGPNASAGNDA